MSSSTWRSVPPPDIGTTPEYHEQRGLAVAQGTLPLVLGQAALGARTATMLGLAPSYNFV